MNYYILMLLGVIHLTFIQYVYYYVSSYLKRHSAQLCCLLLITMMDVQRNKTKQKKLIEVKLYRYPLL